MKGSVCSEEEEHSPEEHGPEERPISALAPQADSQEEILAFAAANPAIQCLEELCSAGKLTGARAAELKASVKQLQDSLKSFQESEVRLQQEAKRYTSELQRQRWELERAERFDEAPSTEAGGMRQQVLNLSNDLWLSEERQSHQQFQLERLEDRKDVLHMERKPQLKAAELEKKVEGLKESCEELKKEITQRHVEIKSLEENLEAKQKHLRGKQQELHGKNETIELFEAQLVQLLSVPLQLKKETERITSKKEAASKRKAELDEQFSEMGQLLKNMETQLQRLEEERQKELQELENQRRLLEAAERKQGQLQQEQSMTSEKLAALSSQRCLLEINLSHAASEKQSMREILARRVREKDRQLRSLKRLELQVKLASEALEYTESQCSRTKTQRDAVPKSDEILERRKKLEREVEILKRNIMHQQSMTEAEALVVEQALEKEQALIQEAHRCRQNVHHLRCLTQIKADERQQKSRELIRAQQRFNRIKQELRGKSLVIWEHRRETQDVQARLSAFAKLFDVVKNERNRCVHLIQMASQNLEKMQENSRYQENQMRIMHTTATNYEKLLQKSQLKHRHSCTIRDSLRDDISKVACSLTAMSERREEQKLSIGSLTQTIDLHEQSLLHLQKSHDQAKQSRRERGIQLLEREQEIHSLQKKLSLQDSRLQEGNMEVQSMEEEIRFLNVHVRKEKRQIKLLWKQLLDKKSLEEQITTLQKQLLEYRDRVQELEEAVVDPAQENRIRSLVGEDPTPAKLSKKIEKLEEHLAEQESQLLEKELLYEQVTRLCERIQAKAENGKQGTLVLAKKVNKVQGHIKDTTRKMMALLSELSMQQATAMALQQELKNREHHLDSCCRRLEQGLPPSPDMELEWQRAQSDKHHHKAVLQERARLMEEEKRNQLPDGTYTTAEPRPNSYLPQGAELPLPRPYGALAPFKPTELGSNMRHIRKPEPKPIEI
uniref:Coiled-coil domain containing 146 n=1 Tax=Paramormyrops kingsleyae TaxID=1676925 RepID=A0A3B3QBB1_9TELE|nr:coiled-coil domain-containing protein 146 [Paramormyrops kingsleyae]XP_023666259.1 coiled-coil domain-containing protein 146 [Paramormyrops kingsleyae]XP_023666260.1 coiled-coil domain-containing protein 146 [Paramormyrops kingsleyae]XP_023666262.1 coiled-coil domain-containing protein 146 [Paramormyrops kingsleyae]